MSPPSRVGDAGLDLALTVPVFGRGWAVFHMHGLCTGVCTQCDLCPDADQAAGGAARETARSRATM